MVGLALVVCVPVGCGTDNGGGAQDNPDSGEPSRGREAGGTGGDRDDAGGASSSSGGAGSLPVDSGKASCEGLITDADRHPMTELTRPALGAAATDPEFGTRIVRVSDVASETGGEVIKPVYSTIQAWNADESFLILYEVGGGHRLYDGRTYEFVRRLDISPPDLEQVYWHPLDPDILYYADGNELIEFSVSANSGRAVHTFSGCRSVSGGDDPMYLSWDGNTIGLLCSDTEEAFLYHLDTDTETAGVAADGVGPQVGPSGETAYLVGEVYDGSMTLLRTLDLDNPYDHASLGRFAGGNDFLAIVAFDPGSGGSGVGTLVVFDLITGEDTVIVGEETGYPYPPSGTHISAVAHHSPGWVSVSVVGYDYDGQDVLDNELLLANANTGEVCRIAHHRSHGRNGPQGYWAEPHASISPTGTRVVFASDWGGGDTVDTYVVQLPAYGG